MEAKVGGLAQLARALAWHARGHRFDSDILHQIQRTAFRKGRRFLLDSPPLHVQHARVPLEAAEREGQNERSEQRVLPEGDQDVHPCVGAAHRVLGGRDHGEAQKDGEEAVVFALQDVAQ